jgi:uncharacterized protein YbaP (TraB family)
MKIIHIVILFILTQSLGFGQTTEKSLFWEISGKGLKEKSYLYGTMHIQDNRVFNFKEGVLTALDSADYFLMELNLDSVNPLELMGSLIMKDGATLETLLKKKDYQLVNKYFTDSLKMSLFTFNALQPFYTATLMSAKDFKKEQSEALDAYFNTRAKKNKIPVIGLEKVSEQLAAFSALPYDFQANYLLDAVKEAYKAVATNEEDILLSAYLNGDIEQLLTTTLTSIEDPKINELFVEQFITKRNQVMVDRLVPFLSKGSTFTAVGAAHLGGEKGIITLLRKLGYTVTAL